MNFSEEMDKPIGWRNGRMVTPRQLNNEKAAADHHNVYVVELLQDALKRKKLLRDNPKADLNKPPLYVGSTGHPVEQRFNNHKNNIKGNVFVQKYGLKLRPDLYTKYNPMSFANAEAKEVELAKQLRAEGYAVVGGKEKQAESTPPLVTPQSPLHPQKMLQRVSPAPNSSVALQGFNRDTIGGFDKGTNILSHSFLNQHPTNAVLINMHGVGPPETPGMQVVDPRYASRFQYTVSPDTNLVANYKHPMPAYPLKALLPFLNKQTGGKVDCLFNESCNPEGGMTPQLIKDSIPGVTNVVAIPPGRLGAQGNDYHNPNYTNASHQIISKALNPNSPTYNPNVTQGDLLHTLETLTQRSAPPNMYRFENNRWINRGAYNPAEVPTTPMNNFHDDLSGNPIWKKLLSMYPPTRQQQ